MFCGVLFTPADCCDDKGVPPNNPPASTCPGKPRVLVICAVVLAEANGGPACSVPTMAPSDVGVLGIADGNT